MPNCRQTAHQIEALDRTDDVKTSTNENIEFASMMLSPHVLQGLSNAGFMRPSPIQLEAIPIGRCGFDLIVQAKSGTGKTCVFTVIALETVNVDLNNIQVLVLAPTREIVVQVSDVINSVGSAMPNLKCHTFIGGIHVSKDKQHCRSCHIAVGTPGRVKQLIKDKILNPKSVRLFVLDEADKLMDESFQRDINWIYHFLPENKQMLALSATYPEELAEFLTKYMQSPSFVRLNASNPALLGIHQFYRKTTFHPLTQKCFENKIPHIVDILSHLHFGQCLIFSNYQMQAQSLCDRLSAQGWPATYICGKMEQNQRMMVMAQMKQFQCRILVSTDLTSRGIDVYNINLIINLDVPYDLETYLHRIGRAGRFGSHGIAITLAAGGEEERLFQKIRSTGNLMVTRLPDEINSKLWSMEVPVSSLTDDDDNNFNSNSEDGVAQHKGAVSAGLLETMKQEENLRKAAAGYKQKLENKQFRNLNKSAINYEKLGEAVSNLISGDDFECEENTSLNDEQDLEEFLKNVKSSNCKVCENVSRYQEVSKRRSRDAFEQYRSRDFQAVREFMKNMHRTFFENLKRDLGSILNVDTSMNRHLEEWMSQLSFNDNLRTRQRERVPERESFQSKNKVEFKNKQLREKAQLHYSDKSFNAKHSTKEFKSCDNLNTPRNVCDSVSYNSPPSGEPSWDDWYRWMRVNKYLVWYREYTTSMLNFK